MKRAQLNVNSKVLEYILAAIVAVLVITATFILISNLREKNREALLIEFEEELKSNIQVMASRVGSVDKNNFNLPDEVTNVCFTDNSRALYLLTTMFVSQYPFIRDILDSNSRDNVFLLNGNEVIQSFYGGPICFDRPPYYKCSATPQAILDVFVEGGGSCSTIGVNWTGLISNNERNGTKYQSIELLMVPDDTASETWRDIAQVVTLAFWSSGTQSTIIPLVAYYHESPLTEPDDFIALMNDHAVRNVTVFRGKPYNEDSSTPTYTIVDDTLDNYLSYWAAIDELTVTGYDNEDGALITSLFAAFINTPLLFLDDSNCQSEYLTQITGKSINLVDESTLSQNALDCINDNAIIKETYDSSDLRVAYLSPTGFTELISKAYPKE